MQDTISWKARLARAKRRGTFHLIGAGLALVVVGLFAAAVVFVSFVLILLGTNIGGGRGR